MTYAKTSLPKNQFPKREVTHLIDIAVYNELRQDHLICIKKAATNWQTHEHRQTDSKNFLFRKKIPPEAF